MYVGRLSNKSAVIQDFALGCFNATSEQAPAQISVYFFFFFFLLVITGVYLNSTEDLVVINEISQLGFIKVELQLKSLGGGGCFVDYVCQT